MEKAQLSDNPASTKQLHGTSTPHMHLIKTSRIFLQQISKQKRDIWTRYLIKLTEVTRLTANRHSHTFVVSQVCNL